MATSSVAKGLEVETYKIVFDSWRREGALCIQAFTGTGIATAILALISLGGSWWPLIFGIGISLGWLVISAQSIARQDHLYAQLEEMGQATDGTMFHVHRFAEAELHVPRLERAGAWARLLARYLFLGTPAVLALAWFIGFIVWAVT